MLCALKQSFHLDDHVSCIKVNIHMFGELKESDDFNKQTLFRHNNETTLLITLYLLKGLESLDNHVFSIEHVREVVSYQNCASTWDHTLVSITILVSIGDTLIHMVLVGQTILHYCQWCLSVKISRKKFMVI